MRRVGTNDLAPGMAAGAELTAGDRGTKLLTKGSRLTRAKISKIRNWGIDSMLVEEERAGDGKGPDARPPAAAFAEAYLQTINEIVEAFRHVRTINEVPVMQMRELVDQRVSLLCETIGVIEFLCRVQCHSEYTFRHSLNVAVIAGLLGKWCGYKGAALKNLILAGLLHDIGKMSVPLSILDKPGALTPEEFAVIKRHSGEGYKLVKDSGQIGKGVKLSILQHHERLDGSGYPHGLDGDKIHADAKIIAVADIYDAMTSDRSYRPKQTPFAAMETIADQMYQKIDPRVCLTFLDNMRDRLIGCKVALDDGRTAQVVAFTARDRQLTKPVVRLEDASLLDLQKTGLGIAGIRW